MCNTCSTNSNSCSTSCYGYNYGCGCGCSNNSLLNLLFGNGNSCGCHNGCGLYSQSVCRDCNGCLRIINRQNGCCCHCGCGCNNGNSGNTSGTDSNGNGNGNFACLTVCGRTGNTATQTSLTSDAYYAQQYGLTGRSGSRCSRSSYGCGCY